MVLEPANSCALESNLKQIEKEFSGVSLSKDQAKGKEYNGPSTPSTPLMDTPDSSSMAVDDKQQRRTMIKSFNFSPNGGVCTTEESSPESHEDPIVLPFSPAMLEDIPFLHESNLSPEDRSQLVEDLEGEQRGEEDESSSSSYRGDIESISFVSSINDDSSSALTLEMPERSQGDPDMSERFGEISPIIPLSEEDELLEILDGESKPIPQLPSTPTYLAEQRSSVICSRELGFDELPPIFNVAKFRSRMFGNKKGRQVPSQAKPLKKLKKCGSVMKDCGSVKLEAVERYRPEFSDLVAVQTVDAHKGFVWVVAFSTNGNFIATGGQDGRVCVWKVGDMVAYTEINVDKTNAPACFGTEDVEDWEHGVIRKRSSVQAYSKVHKNGRILNPEPVFKSPEEGNSRHSADVTTLSWTRDGLLLSGSLDGTVRLWKIVGEKRSESKEGGGKCISRFACQSRITSVAAHPIKPQHFVCGTLNEILYLWNTGTGELLCSKKLPAIPTAIMFTQDGTTVLVGLSNGTVQIRNSTMALCSIAKVSPGYKITGLAIYRNARGIVVSSADNTVRTLLADGFKHSKPVLNSVKSISKVRKMNGHTNKRLSIIPSISDDERFIISGSEDGHVYVWDASDSLDGSKSSKTFTGFERWAVSEEGTVATHAQFFPQASVDRCVAQIEHFRRIRQLLDSEGTAKGLIGFVSPMANPTCRIDMLKGSSKGEPPCSGQQRAMTYGHAHQDASHIRAAAVNSGDGKAQRRCSDTAGSYQIDGDQRSSTALLQGWRKMQRGGDTRDINGIQNSQAPSAAPQNAIVVAAEASGRLVVYAKSSIVSEFRSRLDLHDGKLSGP